MGVWTYFWKYIIHKAIKKIVVFQVPCQKKTGLVGRLYFFFLYFFLNFFFLLFFFFANSTKQFFSLFSSKKVQAMSSGCGSWWYVLWQIFYKQWEEQRSQNASYGHPLTRLHRMLIISNLIIVGVYAVGGGGGFCQRLSAVSHNTVSFESMSMLWVSTVFVYATNTEYNMLQRLAGNGVKRH